MKIYHYNAETQELIAEGNADADPLDAGRFLLPAHSTDTPPPIAKAGKTRHFAAGGWEYRDIPIPPEPPAPTPEEVRVATNAAVIAKLAAIDAASIRSVREYIAAKPDAPILLKTKEQEAQAERLKIK